MFTTALLPLVVTATPVPILLNQIKTKIYLVNAEIDGSRTVKNPDAFLAK